MRESIIALVIFFLISSPILAQKTSDPLIVFSSDATKSGKQGIFIMDINGDHVKEVAHIKDMDCYSPKFSPDGRKIVFNATDVRSDYLYVVDLDDTGTFRFPKFIDGGNFASFSPDGKSLLFHSEKDDENSIFITDLQTDSSEVVSDGSLSTHPKFSPDGRKVVYSSSAEGNFDLVVVDLDDTSENAVKDIANTKDAELYGTFSPDGSRIAYSAFDIKYKGTVHVCDSEGNGNRAVTSGGSAYNPKFSPDGSRLAFIWDKTGNFEVYVCDADGSGVKQLTSKSGNTMEFDWSPDGKKIAYESMSGDNSSITVIDIDTGKKENLTGEKANNINPAFQH